MIRIEANFHASPELDQLVSSIQERGSLLLILSAGARHSPWAEQVAIALADQLGSGPPTLLFDLIPDSLLHEHLGADNLEGLADVFLFGASLKHITQPVRNHAFVFVSAGAAADFDAILADARWRRLLGEAQSGGQFAVVLAAADTPGLDHIAARVGAAVAIATEGALALEGIKLLDVIAPPAPPTARAAASELTPDQQYEAIKLPRNAAREALIADLRARQRSALMAPPPVLPEPIATGAPSSPRAGGETFSRPAVFRPAASITEPTFSRPSSKAGVKSRWVAYTGLSLLVVAAFAVGTWVMLRGEMAQTRTPGVPGSTGAAAPLPAIVPLPYSVAVEAHQQLPTAIERVNALRADEREVGFYIAPVLLDSVLYYRVMAGPVADSAAAGAVMRSLLEKGHKTGATQWDVRAAPLAFLIGEFESRGDAEKLVQEAIDLAIPAYVVELPLANGMRHRVYAGAYAGPAEADVMRQLLKSAGLPDSLVQRVGARK